MADVGPDRSSNESVRPALRVVTGRNAIRAEGRTQTEARHQGARILAERPSLKDEAVAIGRVLGWLSTCGLACLAWLWLGVALPFLTDASCHFLVAIGLAGTWLLLAVAWVALAVPSFSLGRTALLWWLAAGAAEFLGLVLTFTDVGLMVRIALCESSLSAYAAQVPPDGGNLLHASRPVGLFLVDGEENEQGVVFLYTSNSFLNREGVAFVPHGTTPPAYIPRHHLRHLYGPWYWFYWKF